jgi:hypothetical protein
MMTTRLPRPLTKPLSQSPAAERMRLHRERRRKGLRCLTVELRETEIDGLISRGLLEQGAKGDARAIRKALYRFLSATLTDRA